MKKIIYFSLTIIALVSCKKNDEAQPATIEGTWIRTDEVTNGVNTFSALDECEKDDLLVLRTDKTYELNEGATKCDSDDDQVFEKGTFTVSADLKTLVVTETGSSSSITMAIEELTSSAMKIKETYGATNYTTTYKRK